LVDFDWIYFYSVSFWFGIGDIHFGALRWGNRCWWWARPLPGRRATGVFWLFRSGREGIRTLNNLVTFWEVIHVKFCKLG
jgi:hypothetical protein